MSEEEREPGLLPGAEKGDEADLEPVALKAEEMEEVVLREDAAVEPLVEPDFLGGMVGYEEGEESVERLCLLEST